MTKVRPELIQATENNLPNAFLEPQWPEDIPRACPCCNRELHPKINLSYGYGRAGRFCLKTAHWITLPWVVVVFFIILPWLMNHVGTGNGAGFALCVMFLVPAVFFAVLARIMPRTRRVQCFPCKYSADYSTKQ
ncbi:MAG: hypothetical protein ACPG32_05055 [Akkermansiaceae bacterium]